MRIAFFVSRFPVVTEPFITSQVSALLDRGHDVDIYAHGEAGSAAVAALAVPHGILRRTVYLPELPKSPITRAISVPRLLLAHYRRAPRMLASLDARRFGRAASTLRLLHVAAELLARRLPPYDVVHGHFGPNGLLAASLRELGVVRGAVITTFYGYDASKEPTRHGRGVYRPLFERGDRFIAISAHMASSLVDLGCPAGKIRTLPLGVDLARLGFADRARRPGEPVRILTVARLVEKKGLRYSIEAVAQVARCHPDILYQIAGDGPLAAPLRRLVGQLGLADRVQLLGSKTHDEVRELLRAADIYVLASVTARDGNREGMPHSLLEAQASGLPVVSTLHSGIPEAVLDGRSGFLVPERDVGRLAERLCFLIERPDLWPAMGRAGRRLVEQRFDLDAAADRLVGLYREACT